MLWITQVQRDAGSVTPLYNKTTQSLLTRPEQDYLDSAAGIAHLYTHLGTRNTPLYNVD